MPDLTMFSREVGSLNSPGKSPTPNCFKYSGAQTGWIQVPVTDFCLDKTWAGVYKGDKGKKIIGVWAIYLLERERSGCFSIPPTRKRFSRAGKWGRRRGDQQGLGEGMGVIEGLFAE